MSRLSTIHAFGEFELDERLYELRRAGAVVRIEPKVFDVVRYLITHADRVVSKDELLGALWPGEHVSESVLPRCITVARKALADDPGAQRVIQTVHGRGYRFVAALRSDTAPVPVESASPPALVRSVFVGRGEAMATLRDAFAEAARGRSRLVLLVGEPGIGKTRTAGELGVEARAAGALVLTGRCYEGEGAPAFWPWMQVLRTLARGMERDAIVRALGAAAADVGALVPELGIDAATEPGAVLTPEQARFRLFDGIAMLLAAAAGPQPVVLVVDDLHWADKPSLLLLQFVARQLRETRLLVLGAYRDLELRRHHPLAAVLGELAREPHYVRVALRGLAVEDVERFVAASAGRSAPESLVRAVHEMTDGNPFFVGEIVRWLADQGKLDRPADGSGLGLALPEGIREAIGRRLDVLSEDCNGVLTVAAVLGREFELPVLAHVAETAPDRTLDLLDEAVRARIVVPHASDAARYFFAHALVREVLYEELSTPLRVRLHRRTGLALEARHGAVAGPRLAEIAHHFFEGAPGGDVGAAITYGERAAEHALACLAYEEAAGHYERTLQALDLLLPTDELRRALLLLALGDAQSRASERERARATFLRAADAARALGRPDLLARAALGFGGRLEFGLPRDDVLVALLDEARAALQGEHAALSDEHAALRVRILGRLVGAAPYSDSLATRDTLSRSAVDLARRLDDPAALVVALAARAWALLGPDHVSERHAIATELVALATTTGDGNTAFLAQEMRFETSLALGDVADADAAVAAMATVAEQLGQPAERILVAAARAGRALSDGRYDEAARAIAAVDALGVRADHPTGRALAIGLGLFLAHERGEVEDMEAALRFFAEQYPWAERVHRVGRALAASEVGRVDDARRDFDALAADGFRDIPRDEHWLITLAQLATVCADLGDAARAGLLIDLLAPFAARNAIHDLLRVHAGSVAHYLARLAATREDWDAASAWFAQALEQNARVGALPALTRSRHEYARMLVRRGRRGDAAEARALVTRVLADAEALGFRRLQSEAAALATELDDPPHRRRKPA